MTRAHLIEKGKGRLHSLKWVGFRGVGGRRGLIIFFKVLPIPIKEMNTTFSRCWGPLESFSSLPHCGRDEIAWWPFTWAARRTLLWNRDYYLQCGICSREPSNPRGCKLSCGIVINLCDLVGSSPMTATWLVYGSLRRTRKTIHHGRHDGCRGREIRYGFAGYGHVILVLSDKKKINRLNRARWFFV